MSRGKLNSGPEIVNEGPRGRVGKRVRKKHWRRGKIWKPLVRYVRKGGLATVVARIAVDDFKGDLRYL